MDLPLIGKPLKVLALAGAFMLPLSCTQTPHKSPAQETRAPQEKEPQNELNELLREYIKQHHPPAIASPPREEYDPKDLEEKAYQFFQWVNTTRPPISPSAAQWKPPAAASIEERLADFDRWTKEEYGSPGLPRKKLLIQIKGEGEDLEIIASYSEWYGLGVRKPLYELAYTKSKEELTLYGADLDRRITSLTILSLKPDGAKKRHHVVEGHPAGPDDKPWFSTLDTEGPVPSIERQKYLSLLDSLERAYRQKPTPSYP